LAVSQLVNSRAVMSVIAHIAHIGITFTIAALCPDDGWARPSDRCSMSFHVGCTLPMSCVYNDKIRSVFTVFKVTRIHCAINAVISVVSKNQSSLCLSMWSIFPIHLLPRVAPLPARRAGYSDCELLLLWKPAACSKR